jgi:hypothetical protein
MYGKDDVITEYAQCASAQMSQRPCAVIREKINTVSTANGRQWSPYKRNNNGRPLVPP